MPLLRAVAVHRNKTALPRDNMVNTFHFTAADATVGTAEAVAEAVRNFYVVTPSGAVGPLFDFFGDQILATGHEVRVYEIDEDANTTLPFEGAPPIHTEVFDHVGRTPGSRPGFPSQVALCLSFKSSLSGSVPPARRRGRIYFGPIAQQFGAETAAESMSPNTTLRDTLLRAGDMLRSTPPVGTTWCIYSRPYEGRGEVVRPGRTTLPAIPARGGSTYAVTDLFVDNRFDTQRRRLERATARETL